LIAAFLPLSVAWRGGRGVRLTDAYPHYSAKVH
jgi:hypothetical protein